MKPKKEIIYEDKNRHIQVIKIKKDGQTKFKLKIWGERRSSKYRGRPQGIRLKIFTQEEFDEFINKLFAHSQKRCYIS